MLHRKTTLFAFSVIAGMVILSSTAWACTEIMGKMTVTGDQGGTSIGIGNGGHPSFRGMQWCGTSLTGGLPPVPSSPAKVSSPVGKVHVAVEPYPGDAASSDAWCVPASQLPDTGTPVGAGSNDPNLQPTAMGKGVPLAYTVTWTTVNSDCMNGVPNTVIPQYGAGVFQAQGVAVNVSASVGGGGAQAGASAAVVGTGTSNMLVLGGRGSGDYLIDQGPINQDRKASDFPAYWPAGQGLICVSGVDGSRGNSVRFSYI